MSSLIDVAKQLSTINDFFPFMHTHLTISASCKDSTVVSTSCLIIEDIIYVRRHTGNYDCCILDVVCVHGVY